MEELQQEEHKRQAELGEYPNKKRNIFIAAVVAISAMVTYAFLAGIIQFEVVDDLSHIPLTAQPPNPNQFDGLLNEDQEYEEEKRDN
jgi:metaxin